MNTFRVLGLALVVILTGNVVEVMQPLPALGAPAEAALLAYAGMLETDPKVESRARCIRRCLIRNQWCVARAILPPQALARWQEDRVQNGPEEHKSMAIIFANPPQYDALVELKVNVYR